MEDKTKKTKVIISPQNSKLSSLLINSPLYILYIKSQIVGKNLKEGQNLSLSVYGNIENFIIKKIENNIGNSLQFGKENDIEIINEEFENINYFDSKLKFPKANLPKTILKEPFTKLKDLIAFRLLNTNCIKIFPRGAILNGPSGSGKTILINQVAQELKNVYFEYIPSSLLLSSTYPPIDFFNRAFKVALEKKPSVLIFDDIDFYCSEKDSENIKVSSILATLIDEIDQNVPIFFIALSSNSQSISKMLKREGRFEIEIKMELPNESERISIISEALELCECKFDIHSIVGEMNGFTSADIIILAKEACFNSIRRNTKQEKLEILDNDISEAYFSVKPSLIKDLLVKIPKVKWNDIGGLDNIKLKIQQCIQWPLLHSEAFLRLNIKPPSGVLLYGPPGCSKTMMAKAVATESKLNFIAIKGPELFSKYVGDTEKAIREIFKKARVIQPSVIFFDEIDAMGVSRSSKEESNKVSDRALSQLLNEMDGIEGLSKVVVVAATNRPDILDKALIRPGRFDRLIYVPPPDDITREQIFKIYTQNMPIEENINLKEMAKKTEGYTGAEICLICREAGIIALEEDINTKIVKIDHFFKSIKNVKKRVSDEMLEVYEKFQQMNI